MDGHQRVQQLGAIVGESLLLDEQVADALPLVGQPGVEGRHGLLAVDEGIVQSQQAEQKLLIGVAWHDNLQGQVGTRSPHGRLPAHMNRKAQGKPEANLPLVGIFSKVGAAGARLRSMQISRAYALRCATRDTTSAWLNGASMGSSTQQASGPQQSRMICVSLGTDTPCGQGSWP